MQKEDEGGGEEERRAMLEEPTTTSPSMTVSTISLSVIEEEKEGWEKGLIKNYEDFYNGIALGILITGILILAFIIIFYYIKNRDQEVRRRVGDTWTDAEGNLRGTATREDRDALRRMSTDPPPTYEETVCRADPPEYKESIMQEELNPEVNRDWANDQANGNLDEEVRETVLQRVNSFTQGKIYRLVNEGDNSNRTTTRRPDTRRSVSTSAVFSFPNVVIQL